MAYKYISENNLYHKQTYMYSEYDGICFLKEYIASREKYLNKCEFLKEQTKKEYEKYEKLSNVMRDLLNIRKALKSNKQDKEVMDLLNTYLKSFEVRKRIYQEYDNNKKPVGSMNFEDYEIYLIFAECMVLSYQHTQCLKYFSCLLKVDDTLLSVEDKMNTQFRKFFSQIIKQEIDIFYQIVKKNEINWED